MSKIKIDIPADFLADEAKTLVVSSETKRLWAVELDLLAEFDRVCKKHGLKYFAISGTLIGAIRHRGFIPWDDDIDVVMMRSEYERLLSIAKDEFVKPYFLQTNYNDPGSLRGHAQLRNSETTGILKSEMCDGKPMFTFNQGIFMDVFPLDRIPDDQEERLTYFAELKNAKSRVGEIRWALAALRRPCRLTIGGLLQKLKGIWFWVKGKAIGRDLLDMAFRDFDMLMRRYEHSTFGQCASLALSQPPRRHEVFDVSDFSESVELPFEFRKMPVPKNYEKVLSGQFGNWHKHLIGDSSHGGMLIDVDRPYTEYLKELLYGR